MGKGAQSPGHGPERLQGSRDHQRRDDRYGFPRRAHDRRRLEIRTRCQPRSPGPLVEQKQWENYQWTQAAARTDKRRLPTLAGYPWLILQVGFGGLSTSVYP